MPVKNQIAIILILVPLLLNLSPKEGGETSATLEFLGKTINFLILFGGLAYVLYKPVRAFLERKASETAQFLADAELYRKNSETRHEAAEARLAGLAEEIGALKAKAEIQGKRERDRIVHLAEDEGRRMKTLTRHEIEAHNQSEIGALKAFVAEKATSLARQRIREDLVVVNQTHLIDKSIERLSRLNEKSSAG